MTSGEQLTLLPAASLASLSVWPGSRQAQRMTVISGQRLLAFLPSCDRELWWLRTLVASSAWRSTMCLLTWEHKVTPAGRSYYRLRVSVPRIDGKEFGWWPTPTVIDSSMSAQAKAGQKGKHSTQLSHLANSGRIHRDDWWNAPVPVLNKLMPTPTVDDANNVTRESGQYQSLTREVMYPTPNAAKAGNDLTLTCSGDGRERPNKLGWAVAAMLPTPRARDANAEGFESGMRRDSPTLPTVVKMGLLPTPTVQDGKNNGAPSQHERNSLPLNDGVQGKLNPAWVSRMMGFPDGWLSLDVPHSIDLLAQGRALQDWAWREDGTKVRVFKIQGQPWQEVTRKTRAGRATP